MKIQYASDLHLEFMQNWHYLKSHPLDINGDILVLAGDIAQLKNKYLQKLGFFSWVADHFQQTLIVPGNHEFYNGFDAAERQVDFEYRLSGNVAYYNGRSIKFDGFEFFLTTLWSYIPESHISYVCQNLNDFRNIRYNGHWLKAEEYNEMHRQSLAWLKQALLQSTSNRKIVVTHHVPTLQLCQPAHIGKSMTSAFCTDLHDFIEGSGVDYWICGHTHSNMPPVCIGKTMVVHNMLGYVESETEQAAFDPGAFLSVSD